MNEGKKGSRWKDYEKEEGEAAAIMWQWYHVTEKPVWEGSAIYLVTHVKNWQTSLISRSPSPSTSKQL